MVTKRYNCDIMYADIRYTDRLLCFKEPVLLHAGLRETGSRAIV